MDDMEKYAQELIKQQMAAAADVMAQQKAMMERMHLAAADPQVAQAIAQSMAHRDAMLSQLNLGSGFMEHLTNGNYMGAVQEALASAASQERALESSLGPPPDLAAQDRFVLGLGAILFDALEASHLWLCGGHPDSPSVKEQCRDMLSSLWDVESLKELKGILAWLTEEGHSAQFDSYKNVLVECVGVQADAFDRIATLADNELDSEDCALIRHRIALVSREFVNENRLLAWDLGRAINVVRWAAGAGLLSEEEAWRTIRKLGVRVKKHFNSWQAFGENYILGCSFWTREEPRIQSCRESVADLLNPDRADSPWVTIPWDTPIVL